MKNNNNFDYTHDNLNLIITMWRQEKLVSEIAEKLNVDPKMIASVIAKMRDVSKEETGDRLALLHRRRNTNHNMQAIREVVRTALKK